MFSHCIIIIVNTHCYSIVNSIEAQFEVQSCQSPTSSVVKAVVCQWIRPSSNPLLSKGSFFFKFLTQHHLPMHVEWLAQGLDARTYTYISSSSHIICQCGFARSAMIILPGSTLSMVMVPLNKEAPSLTTHWKEVLFSSAGTCRIVSCS